jgi:hypothetical protein
MERGEESVGVEDEGLWLHIKRIRYVALRNKHYTTEVERMSAASSEVCEYA